MNVSKGQEIAAGERIGRMGMSGDTDFPHLSFTLRRDKQTVDPFIGSEGFTQCGQGEQQLWAVVDDPILAYVKPEITQGGYTELRPSLSGPLPEHADEIQVYSRQARAIYLWADFGGLRPGDEIWFRIHGPDGEPMFQHKKPIKSHFFADRHYIEFLKRTQIWPDGEYRGTVTLRRQQGSKIKDISIERVVEMR